MGRRENRFQKKNCAHLAIHMPFARWILVGFFATVRRELEEAGLVDGCLLWRLFWNV